MTRRKNKRYDPEFKNTAVQANLSGERSQREICKRFHILTKRMLEIWIMYYNGQKGFKQFSATKGALYMLKGRKTTQQEWAEIVAFCLEHGKDYLLTVEQYGVSYNQIYSWVRKYEVKGIDGLADGRGRTKPGSKVTDTEKLQAQVRMLEAQLRDKQMEMDLLKKVRKLEEVV